MMLIDDFIPIYEFSERHRTRVEAPAHVVRRAADAWQPADSTLWKWLVRLRGLGRASGSLSEWAKGSRFFCLADTPEEVVFGIIGRFWEINSPATIVRLRSVEEFRAFSDPRYAVGVMNVAVRESRGGTLLTTETRVHTLSPSARRKFRLYWLLVGPFSGLMRRSMLNGIKKNALTEAHTLQPSKGS